MSLRIAISIGDINGIGPEVVLKTLAKSTLEKLTPVILGNQQVCEYYMRLSSLSFSLNPIKHPEEIQTNTVNILNPFNAEQVVPHPGSLKRHSGLYAMQAVEQGIELCLKDQADALVTAPISKEAVNLAGYSIPGHTEFLAEKTSCKEYMMMLVHQKLRVGLVTIHEPIANVPGLIDQKKLLRTIKIFDRSLREDFQIASPRIAILGLNPHAGDGGYIGDEEINILRPAVEHARSRNIKVSNPLSADAFFGTQQYKKYDGVLAMYHDQGLIPFKTLSFGSGVNFTAGLPIIRTSPDHGTAFDIAGKNQADPSSFQQALNLAFELAKNKKKQSV